MKLGPPVAYVSEDDGTMRTSGGGDGQELVKKLLDNIIVDNLGKLPYLQCQRQDTGDAQVVVVNSKSSRIM